MKASYTDLTLEIRDQGMYSYDRPSAVFWNAVANALLKERLTREQALAALRSKHARWMLDAHDDLIERMAEHMVRRYATTATLRDMKDLADDPR
jgi:hypothetical protein